MHAYSVLSASARLTLYQFLRTGGSDSHAGDVLRLCFSGFASDESRCRYYDAFSDEWWFDLRGSFGNLPEGEGTHRGLCIVAHCHF